MIKARLAWMVYLGEDDDGTLYDDEGEIPEQCAGRRVVALLVLEIAGQTYLLPVDGAKGDN